MIAKWVLVVLLYHGPDVMFADLMLYASEKRCRDAKVEVLETNKPGDRVIAWADCHPITYEPPPAAEQKPAGDPATERRS